MPPCPGAGPCGGRRAEPRVRLAPALSLAVGLLVALGPAPARADTLRWKLGPDEKLRYDHRPAEGSAEDARLAIGAVALVGAADHQDGWRPRRPVRGPGDLVWHYALAAPEGELPAARRPAITEVADVFPIAGGELRAAGNHAVRRKGRKVTVRSSLVVTTTVKDHWLIKGTLELTRVFDLGRGRLLQATYAFELTTRGEDGEETALHQGTIQTAREPIEVDAADFHVAVQRAIERGRGWLEQETEARLLEQQKRREYERYQLGHLALPCFALLRSGTEPRALERQFAWMCQQPLVETYSVALWVMALEARAIRRVPKRPQERTRSVARYERGPAAKEDLALMERAVGWLVAARKEGEGWWSYFGPAAPGEGPRGHDGDAPAKHGDRSNSQFAVLALHSALASGVAVPPGVWEEIAREAVDSQEKGGPETSLAGTRYLRGAPLQEDARDAPLPGQTTERAKTTASAVERERARARGWSYVTGTRGGAYGSMTCAGASSVAIAREGLAAARRLTGALDAATLEALRDGLAWLLTRYDVARNPAHDNEGWYYYYAYSLEKAMDTAGVERLGAREWWRDLAAELLARQRDDGSWGNVEDTSFALLVLNRATLPAQLHLRAAQRVRTGGVDPAAWDVVVLERSGERVEVSVREALAALADDPGATPLELAQQALAALDPLERPRLAPELAALLEHPARAARRWARETCKLLTGELEPAALARFVRAYEAIRRVEGGRVFEELEQVRAPLRARDASRPLRTRALTALVRLRAVEATPELFALLDEEPAAWRREVWTHLVALSGAEPAPFDPSGAPAERREALARLRAWWDAEGPARVQAERIQRALRDLALPHRVAAAERDLRAIGRPALRALVDGLRSETTRARAHALLQELSGLKHPPDVAVWLEALGE